MWSLPLKMEEGAMSQGTQAASRNWADKEQILLQSLQKEHSPAYTLILAQWDSYLQNSKIINLYN